MKQIRVNVLAIVAVAIGALTMAFNMQAANSMQSDNALYWYEKDDFTGVYSRVPAPPAECLDVPAPKICALGFDSPQIEVTDASLLNSKEQRYRNTK